MSKVLVIALLGHLFSADGLQGRLFERPVVASQSEAQQAAERAASCADFPRAVSGAIGKHYDYEGTIQVSELPETYDIRHVAVYPEGGCLVKPATTSVLPAMLPGEVISVSHAIGIVHVMTLSDHENPFYVLIELEGPSSTSREYYVLRLPKPSFMGAKPSEGN